MANLKQIENVLRKSENAGGTTCRMLDLSDHQWAALIAALSFWKQEVKHHEDDPGVGIYEPCGVAGIEGIQAQLEDGLEFILEEP